MTTQQIENPRISETTLRDLIAAKALQGILSNAANYGQDGILESGQPAIAKAAYELADEMLKARLS